MTTSEASACVGTFEIVHTDQRRTISEFNGPHFSIQQFQVHTSLPLGNHYHTKKSETFIILEGGGKVMLAKINVGGSLTESAVVEKLHKDSVVHVAPYIAHTFSLWPGSKMICFSSAPYDPENPDMHQHQLVVPTL